MQKKGKKKESLQLLETPVLIYIMQKQVPKYKIQKKQSYFFINTGVVLAIKKISGRF